MKRIIILVFLSLSIVITVTANTDSLALRDALSEQTDYLKFVQNEQRAHREFLADTIKDAVWAIGILSVAIISLFTFMGYRNWKQFKQTAIEAFNQRADKLLHQQFDEFNQQKIIPLQRQLNVLKRYQSSTILFLGETRVVDQLQSFIQPIFHQSGIRRLIFAHELIKHDIQHADIVVLHYDPDQSVDLEKVLFFLKGRTVPLVIYSPDGLRQTEQEKAILSQHQWYTFANMPLSLVTQIYNAASVFYGSRV